MSHDKLKEILDAHEATWQGPGWKSHLRTLWRIALLLGLIYLLVSTCHETKGRETKEALTKGQSLSHFYGDVLLINEHVKSETPTTKVGGLGSGQLVGAGDSTAGGISWPEFPDLLCRYGMFHLFLFSIKKKGQISIRSQKVKLKKIADPIANQEQKYCSLARFYQTN